MAYCLSIAVFLVCFYDALIMMFLPSSATLLMAEDGSAASMVCMLSALGIGLWSLNANGFKKPDNPWMLLLIFFVVFSSFHSPNVNFDSTFLPKDGGIFNFKPMFEMMVYFVMFLGVANWQLSLTHRRTIELTLAWIGIVYSGYIICQNCGLDQLYKLVNIPVMHLSANPQNGGFISQPVFAAALLVVCAPFVMQHIIKFLPIMLLAMVMTGNRSVLVCTAFIFLFLATNSRKSVLWGIVAYTAILGLVVAISWRFPGFNFHINPHGRIEAWTLIIKDFLHPHFPGVMKTYILTGLGIGSFSVFFPFYNNSNFFQAHNEYLEVIYALSPIGLYLFLRMLYHMLNNIPNWSTYDRFTKWHLYSGLLVISVFAMTNPVWHIPQLQFLTVFLAGLAYNKESTYAMGTVR